LLFSTLYPSTDRPTHGIFVETRLRELVRRYPVEAKVVAPVPWFPSRDPRWGSYARLAATPRREFYRGVDVLHPRYPLPPRVGMTVAPLLLALGSLGAARQLLREGFDFDVVDAHYFYPDVVAGALIAKWCGRPLVATARGTDVNLIGQYTLPRAMMRWAARRAAACFGVSRALCDRLLELGASPESVEVLVNGVDSERFRPEPARAARERLGLGAVGPVIVSVGNLVPLKRHQLVLEAFAVLRKDRPRAVLAIIGDGPLREQLGAHAAALGVADGLRMPGAIEQDQLRWWFSAADLSVLASTREGWPNVLLESMACGTPVLASRVGGVPEIVATPTLGRVFEAESPQELASAIANALAVGWDRGAIRAYAQSKSWDATSRRQAELFGALARDRTERQCSGPERMCDDA
jgi:glycosyltransferase involved in cell wall biosynthesis